jgi:hypothetical protein
MQTLKRISKQERLAQIEKEKEPPINQFEYSNGLLAKCLDAVENWDGIELITIDHYLNFDIDNLPKGNPLNEGWHAEEIEYIKTELEKLGWNIEVEWPGSDGPDSITLTIT